MHKKRYGTWAGNPDGQPADLERCCVEVFRGRWTGKQCSKPRGHGPNKMFCHIHNPDSVAKRQAASAKKFRKEAKKRNIEVNAHRFLDALRVIAKGTEDPQKVAKRAIKGFKGESR